MNKDININSIPLSTAVTALSKLLGVNDTGKTELFPASALVGFYKGNALTTTNPGTPAMGQIYTGAPGTYTNFKDSTNAAIVIPSTSGGQPVGFGMLQYNGTAWVGTPITFDLALYCLKSQGVTFQDVVTPPSNNIFNPAVVVVDSYINGVGVVTTGATPSGTFAMLPAITWGANTQFVFGFNGVAHTAFSVAQYDGSGAFISGSYQGADNVNGPVTKYAGAVTFKISFRVANVNQINWGGTLLTYDAYFAGLITKRAIQDGNGVSSVFKPDIADSALIAFLNATYTTLAKGVTYQDVVNPPSNNVLNPALVITDQFVGTTGFLGAGTPGVYATLVLPWGSNTQITFGKDGVAALAYSLAQYDSAGTFLSGSYAGADNVSGPITKAASAVTIKISYRVLNINQFNFGGTLLAYDAYFAGSTTKKGTQTANGVSSVFTPDTTDAALLALLGLTKTTETAVQPNNIYTLCNDLSKTINQGFSNNNFASVLYVDHFINPTVRKKVNFRSSKNDKLPVFAPVAFDNSSYNGGVSSLSTTINDVIEGSTINDIAISFSRKSVLASAVASKFPKVLHIGDSVTAGTGAFYPITATTNGPAQYWSHISKLNYMYKLQNGNSGFDYLSLGTLSTRVFNFNSFAYKSFAEGRGGWSVSNYLFDATFGGYSNYFYDVTKAGSNKFSLAKYLAQYKTLNDDGVTRLSVGTTAGTLVTDVNAADVCTPTHVTIQLGFNDLATDYQTNLPLMIAAIKAEYPNMIVIISIIDAAGTIYPERYPNFTFSGIDMLGDTLHAKMWGLVNFVKGLENPATRVHVCLNYFIQPTAWGQTTRDINLPEYLVNPIMQFVMQDEFGAGDNFHPGVYAHASWAYQLDAIYKYTALLYL